MPVYSGAFLDDIPEIFPALYRLTLPSIELYYLVISVALRFQITHNHVAFLYLFHIKRLRSPIGSRNRGILRCIDPMGDIHDALLNTVVL